MTGSNILTTKQLEKMSSNQFIDFAMKVQENLISKQNTHSNENKEINAKLHNIDMNNDQLHKENNLLGSRLSIAENTPTILAKNYNKHIEKIINLETDLHKMEQYSWQECIDIAAIPLSIKNDLLEEHTLLIFSKTVVTIDEVDIVVCHILDPTDRAIVKLLNRTDTVKLLENKNKLKYVDLYENSSNENYNKNLSSNQVSVSEQVNDRKNFSYKKPKLFLNQSLCPYYRMLCGRAKELAREGLIYSFRISNGTIKMKELSESQPVSITHLTDFED